MWAELLGVETVPVLYKGEFDKAVIEEIARTLDPEKTESFVVRNCQSFHYTEFAQNMGKYVRENHVQTDKHWMFAEIVPNQLAKGELLHEPI